MNIITAKNLTAPTPSDGWMQKLRTSLTDFAAPDGPFTAALYDENGPGRHACHCVYSVGLQTVKGLKKLDGINKPFCWRFFADGQKTSPMAACCFATHELNEPDGLPAKVIATLQGPEVADVLASAEQLNHLSQVSDPNCQYELRVLRIPGLCVEAFWLKSLSAERGDLIVPYGLCLDGKNSIKLFSGERLDKNQAYPVDKFLKIIGDAAVKRLAADDNTAPARWNRSLKATGRPWGSSRAASQRAGQ
jgi:hypothetical protein